MFYSQLGARIRAARLKARISQEQLAKSIPMSRSSVANIETGRQPVYVHALMRIATILRVGVPDLIPEGAGNVEGEAKRLDLVASEQRWVAGILRKSSHITKEKNGTEIRPSEKAGRRTSQGSRN